MFACAGALAFAVKNRTAAIAIGAVVLVAGVGTGFVAEGLRELLPATSALALVIILLVVGASHLPEVARRRALAIGAIVLLAIVGTLTFVYFDAFVRAPGGYVETRTKAWKGTGYGALAGAWEYLDRTAAPDATVAYANTFYTYPLYGPGFARRVVYAPTRAGVRRLHDLPAMAGRRLSGEEIVAHVASELTSHPDRDVWLGNIARADPDYLLVAKPGIGPSPNVPELDFAGRDPLRFQPAFENDAAVVYRIVSPATNPAH
jgi:hypothetical protein